MKQMVAPEAPVKERIFLANMSGNFFRQANDPEGKIFYGVPDFRVVRGFYCYAVMEDGTVSRIPEVSLPYTEIIDVIEQETLGVKELLWENEAFKF